MQDLKLAIIEDGKVDAKEVLALKTAIYEDGVVELEEVQTVFAIADATSDNVAEFTALMVETVKDFAFTGDTILDETEGEAIYDLIMGDGEISPDEVAVLEMIKETATDIQHDGIENLIKLHVAQ